MMTHTYRAAVVIATVLLALAGCSSAGGGGGTATFTVTYNDNGADSGSVPVAPTVYDEGAEVTAAENIGDLARDGFPFFVGWSTAADGNGELYAPGDTFAMPSSDTTLYAAWIDQADLPRTADGYFGGSVAVDGDYAIVGVSQEGAGASGGAAVIYRRNGPNSWDGGTLLDVTGLDVGDTDDFFGWAVAIEGDYAVVGAPGWDESSELGGPKNNGRAFVFRRTGLNTWGDVTQLHISGGDADAESSLGESVAISGDYAIIGADGNSFSTAGTAYVFRRTGENVWTDGEALVPEFPPSVGDSFGSAVALSGDTAVVGASGASSNEGRAYLFRRTGTSWGQGAELDPGAYQSNALFGLSLSMTDDTIVVGEPGAGDGRVVVFERAGTDWSTATVTPIEPTGGAIANSGFGGSVAVSGDFIAVGAPDIAPAGAAYLFRQTEGGGWTDTLFEPAGTDAARSEFGGAIALDGTTVIVGDDFYDSERGAAYAWRYR